MSISLTKTIDSIILLLYFMKVTRIQSKKQRKGGRREGGTGTWQGRLVLARASGQHITD